MKLTLNGEDQFKTIFGASVTTVLSIIMLAYLCYRSYYLVNRYNPNVIKTTLIKNLTEAGVFTP